MTTSHDTKWEKYSSKFTEAAILRGFEIEDINVFLAYAKKLHDQNIPIIYNQDHLSLLLGFDIQYLRKVSNASRLFYRRFTIPKKSGGDRQIAEPLPNLKIIQRWILDNILYKIPVSRFAKAYIKNRSIKQNASFHLKKDILLSLDISNFFGSLKEDEVFHFYYNLGYAIDVSTMLTKISCLEGSLPQGAPTSATLSNLLMRTFDKRISTFCLKRDIRYTRYADDLNFSGNFEPGMIINFVSKVLLSEHLSINPKKIRTRSRNQRQEVTGVTVNEKLQTSRKYRRKIRQEIYHIRKYGLESHLERLEITKANYIYHLLGKINFVLFINPEDDEFIEYKKLLIDKLKNVT